MTDNQQQVDAGVGSNTGRIKWLEYAGDDFPFYNGLPVQISAAKWCFILAMVALGFGSLIVPFSLFQGKFGQFIPAILFVAVPLLGLALVTPSHWTALFRRIRGRDILWMIAFALLNVVLTLIIGYFVMTYYGASSNDAIAGLKSLSGADSLLFYLRTLPQLVGEEVLSILPFLALLTYFYSHHNVARPRAIFYAWLLTALLFGAVHLPTYGWNFVQCFVVIGSARLILILPYIMTKNLWVSSGAHILNDWIFFTATIVGASYNTA